MKTLKKALNFYINSSIHVSIAVCALVVITLLNFDKEVSVVLLLFVFFSSIITYNLVKYGKLFLLNKKDSLPSLRYIKLLTLIAVLCVGYLIFKIAAHTLLYFIPFSLLTILYMVPIAPNSKTLRNLPGVKIYIIAIVWTGITVLIPLLNNSSSIDNTVLLELVQRFLFIIVLMLPFEIRDLKEDTYALVTIPQKLGMKNTKILGTVLLMLFIILSLIKNQAISSYVSEGVIFLITLVFLWKSKIDQSMYYSSLWVESIPVIWLCLVVLLEAIFGHFIF